MDHPAFVDHLVDSGYNSCGPGCLAHIPCDWMDIANANQSLSRHIGYLAEFPGDFLKPGEQSEGWCVLWAKRGTNNGSGTYMMPKYWLQSPNLGDINSPPILKGRYKTAFEVFRRTNLRPRIACRSMLEGDNPDSRLESLRKVLGAPTCEEPPIEAVHSKSSLSVEIGYRAIHSFPYLADPLIKLLQGTDSPHRTCSTQAFKDFVLLAPAVIPL
jgi:hypothetical protein